MEDIDRFGAKTSDAGGGDARGLAALRAAVAGAEAALEAVELEGDLRSTLQDQGSLDVAAVPRLEALMLRAAKVAERKPPLTQEGAAKLNTLVSRCFSRATALQEMEGARAVLAEALEPSLRGRDISPGPWSPGTCPDSRRRWRGRGPARGRGSSRMPSRRLSPRSSGGGRSRRWTRR